jgi:predicted XRE-type DNA-binding protein
MQTDMINAEEEPISTPSCGNVFADLDLPDPELLLAKAKLCAKISRIIRERKLTQKQAAKLMGLTQPNVSDLLRGRLDGFTLDRLFRCLDALGQEIEIVVRPKRPLQTTA